LTTAVVVPCSLLIPWQGTVVIRLRKLERFSQCAPMGRRLQIRERFRRVVAVPHCRKLAPTIDCDCSVMRLRLHCLHRCSAGQIEVALVVCKISKIEQ
jgi:hypothetical protein